MAGRVRKMRSTFELRGARQALLSGLVALFLVAGCTSTDGAGTTSTVTDTVGDGGATSTTAVTSDTTQPTETSEAEEEVGEAVTFAMTQGIPPHLDATLLNDTSMAGYVKAAIHDTLLRANQDGSVDPALASSFEYEDDTTLLVELRDDVTFHDGSTLDAEDVKYTFDRMLDADTGSVYSGDLEMVDSVEVVDGATVRISLSRPFAPFLLRLGSVPIIPSDSGDQQMQDPVGAGPFAFESWEEGVSINVTAFADYYGGSPGIEGIEMVSRSDATAMRAGFESGELDIIAFFAWTDAAAIESAAPDAELQAYPGGFVEVALNTQEPPFDDPAVRRAFSMAIDREAIGQAMYGPGSVSLPSFYLPQDHPLVPDDAPIFEYNPEAAAAAFREAGLDEGAQIELLVPDLPQFRPSAPPLQDGLRQAGIELAVPITPAADWVERVFNNKAYQATIWGVSGLPDPSLLIDRYYLSDSPSNFTQFQSEELDELLRTASSETDEAARAEDYGDIIELMHEEVPGIPVVQTIWNIASREWISGFQPQPEYRWTWADVTNSDGG